MLIIENFIPPEEKNKITNRAVFDEDEDSWKIQPLTKFGSVSRREYMYCSLIAEYVLTGLSRPVEERSLVNIITGVVKYNYDASFHF